MATFMIDARAEFAGVQHVAPDRGQQRQYLLKRRALAAGEDGDVAGRGAMAATRYRAVDGDRATRFDQRAEAADFVGIGGTHFEPDLAGGQALQHAIVRLHDFGRHHGRRQAGNDHVAGLGHRPAAFGPVRAACKQRLGRPTLDVAHGQVKAISQQAAGKLGADVAQSNKAYFHRA